MAETEADIEEEGGFDPSPSKDLMFDPWATIPEPAMESPISDIFRQVYAAMLKDSGGKPLRSEVSYGVGVVLPAIMANLMLLHKVRPEGSRLVVRMEHSKLTRYDRRGFRHLPTVVNLLASLGHVIKHPHVFQKKRTRIGAAGGLKDALLSRDIALGDIERAPGEEIIQVTARPEVMRSGPKRLPKEWIDYADTEETTRLRKELDEINSFLSSRSITLHSHSMPAFTLVRRFTLRHKHDPLRFDLHGRLYGGFWMILEATERAYLRIELSDAARREWDRLAAKLSKLRLLTNLDRAALAAYCSAYALWAEAVEAIQKYGAMVKSPNGYPIQSPYVAIANRQAEIMLRISSEFGFTPASRGRIATPMPEEPTLFDDTETRRL